MRNVLALCGLLLAGCSGAVKENVPAPAVVPGHGLAGRSDSGNAGFDELGRVDVPHQGYARVLLAPEATTDQGSSGSCYGGDLTISVSGASFGEANGSFTLYKDPAGGCSWFSGGYNSLGVPLGGRGWILNCNSHGGLSRLVYGGDPHGPRADYVATGVTGPGVYYLEGYAPATARYPASMTVN